MPMLGLASWALAIVAESCTKRTKSRKEGIFLHNKLTGWDNNREDNRFKKNLFVNVCKKPTLLTKKPFAYTDGFFAFSSFLAGAGSFSAFTDRNRLLPF